MSPVRAAETKAAETKVIETKAVDPSAASAKSESKGAVAAAEKILAEDPTLAVNDLGSQMLDDKPTVAVQAARVLDEIFQRKPEAGLLILEKLATGIGGGNPRVVQTCAAILPIVARIAPARVARHLESLTESFPRTNAVGKDGLVRTFAALCSASVAYQKRLEPVLDTALSEADAKTTAQWTEIVLPALKGEPHARARAVIERRLTEFPRPVAQKIADFLGIKLRRPVP